MDSLHVFSFALPSYLYNVTAGSSSDENLRRVFSRAADPWPCARNWTSSFKALPVNVNPDCVFNSSHEGMVLALELSVDMVVGFAMDKLEEDDDKKGDWLGDQAKGM